MEKIENYKTTRKEFQNRHSKVNQKRMYVLAELGKESERTRKNTTPDEFGIKDEDWEIYRGISRHNLSEDEEEDQQQLNEIEAQIIEMDPNYFKNLENPLHNRGSNLFLGVDQFRGPELIFNPSIIGVDQAGVIEIILSILKTFTPEEQKALCNCIFITGGNTKYKYIEDRIRNELKSNLDCEMKINIYKASDPELDGWRGQKNFMLDPSNGHFFISKKEYQEYGADYFKEHFCSNSQLTPYQNNIYEKGEYPNKRKKEI
jgi:actin-related protein 5